MDAHDVEQMTILFTRVAGAARADRQVADQVREALVKSGLLDVFGAAGAVDVVDLLDSGGEAALRMKLGQCTLVELKEIISRNNYDDTGASARWRSANKCIDLIVAGTQKRLEEELAAPSESAAAWML